LEKEEIPLCFDGLESEGRDWLPRRTTMENPMDRWLEGCDFAYFSQGRHKVPPAAFLEKQARGEAVLLDVRTPEEAAILSFPGALHIPLDELPRRRGEVPKDKLVAAFCSVGTRSAVAFAYLQSLGWKNVRFLASGYHDLVEELKPGKILARARKAGEE